MIFTKVVNLAFFCQPPPLFIPFMKMGKLIKNKIPYSFR